MAFASSLPAKLTDPSGIVHGGFNILHVGQLGEMKREKRKKKKKYSMAHGNFCSPPPYHKSPLQPLPNQLLLLAASPFKGTTNQIYERWREIIGDDLLHFCFLSFRLPDTRVLSLPYLFATPRPHDPRQHETSSLV